MARVNAKKTAPAIIKDKDSLIKQARDLAELSAIDNESGLKPKQLHFCQLIAQGGFDQKEAYIEAYNPNPDKVTDRSIIDMSSRLARKPEVKHEIDSIRTKLKEESMCRQERLMYALDARRGNERILLELYAIIVSESSAMKDKLRAIELYGKTKTIDAFTNSTSINNSSNVINGNLGIDTHGTVSAAKEMLLGSVMKMLGPRQAEVIDVKNG